MPGLPQPRPHLRILPQHLSSRQPLPLHHPPRQAFLAQPRPLHRPSLPHHPIQPPRQRLITRQLRLQLARHLHHRHHQPHTVLHPAPIHPHRLVPPLLRLRPSPTHQTQLPAHHRLFPLPLRLPRSLILPHRIQHLPIHRNRPPSPHLIHHHQVLRPRQALRPNPHLQSHLTPTPGQLCRMRVTLPLESCASNSGRRKKERRGLTCKAFCTSGRINNLSVISYCILPQGKVSRICAA
jgi:hypothetical protein